VKFNRYLWGQAFFLACALLLIPLSHVSASEQNEPVRAQLVAEESAVSSGHPFWVAVQLNMAKGWDTYWVNPGDSGFATQVEWHLPEGFKAGPLLWPYPQRFVNDSLVAFGYTDTVMLMAQITPPSHLAADQKVEIRADVNWLACKDSCVPGNASLSLTLPVTAGAPQINQASAPLFTQARKALPQKEGGVTVVTQADQIILTLKPQSDLLNKIEGAQFFPEQGELIDYMAPQNLSVEDGQMKVSVKRVHPEGDLGAIKGVLLVKEKGSEIKRAIQIDSALSHSQEVTTHKGVDGVSSLTMALGFAFVGGLILNVMPCVLPVIALKIFSFVKLAQQRRRLILQHGGVFALGVLISFWVLSGALLLLRAYGEGIGWGFQLQEPVFVVVLTVLLFLLGLSLFGVFEMGTSLISLGSKAPASNTSPLSSSFMSGVLATLVATPCTGPLLGPALGFAMTLPTIKALAIFTSMGVGMAFPYLLFSAFPHLVRFLPKPGNWMIAFKQIMGFLMMGTVVWLVWVFGAQTDNQATFVLLFSLLLMAVGAWIFGKWGGLMRKKATRVIATVLAAILILTSGSFSIMMAKHHRDTPLSSNGTQLVSDSSWKTYSPERVKELNEQGIAVFVDFTAKWCLICQANKVILHSSDMESAFRAKGVVTMIADWTKRDSVITQELQRLGRSGVPVYALYPGHGQGTPVILPQTLTSAIVHDYLEKLQLPATTVYAH
jgi:thiol:disulfide interchange protein